MRELVQGTCFLMALGSLGHSQAFEVASVKVSRLGNTRQDFQSVPGGLTIRNATLPTVVMWAYKVSKYQIAKAPDLDVDRYDIIAKAAGPARTDEMRAMMQSLLVERFKLALHHETREMQAYAMVQAKGGSKLKKSDIDDGRVSPIEGKFILGGKGGSLDQLAAFLGEPLGTPVIDMTGLKGRYDFTLDLTEFAVKGPRQPGDQGADPVAVFQAALPKQLGLKLEARKLPVEVLIIDHVEKAAVEN